jgi:hypothetical protein
MFYGCAKAQGNSKMEKRIFTQRDFDSTWQFAGQLTFKEDDYDEGAYICKVIKEHHSIELTVQQAASLWRDFSSFAYMAVFMRFETEGKDDKFILEGFERWMHQHRRGSLTAVEPVVAPDSLQPALWSQAPSVPASVSG